MARFNSIKFGVASLMVVLSAIGTGCLADSDASDPASDEAADNASAVTAMDPAGTRAGKALLAAFPSFNPKKPIAVKVDEEPAAASDVDIVAASPETKATAGIDHWAISSKGVDGFIGSVRVLAFRHDATVAEGDSASEVPEQVSTWWTFAGKSGTHEVTSASSTTPLDAQGQAVSSVLKYDLEKNSTGPQSLLGFSKRCLAAKAALVAAIVSGNPIAIKVAKLAVKKLCN